MSTDAEAALAEAWIVAQDDLDDPDRMDAVRVAADRLQAEGRPLGELVTLGFALYEAIDPRHRAALREAYERRVAALLPERLGPFADLMTDRRVFDLQWSICFLDRARLPIESAPRYAGLLGQASLDPAGMVRLFLAQPGARCVRRLSCRLGRAGAQLPAVLDAIAEARAPLETVIVEVSALPEDPEPSAALAAMPYLHSLCIGDVGIGSEAVPLPGGDADLIWTGDARSIRALGRAATGADPEPRTRALERIGRLARNAERYAVAVEADTRRRARLARLDPSALIECLRDMSSLEWQRQQHEQNRIVSYWQLRQRWHALVPEGYWHATTPLERLLRAHGRLLAACSGHYNSFAEWHGDPAWLAVCRHAARVLRALEQRA